MRRIKRCSCYCMQSFSIIKYRSTENEGKLQKTKKKKKSVSMGFELGGRKWAIAHVLALNFGSNLW